MAVKKKILFVNDLIKGGGVEKLMYDLIIHLHDKYDITVTTFEYSEGAEEYPDNVRYISGTPSKPLNGEFIARNVNRIVKKVYRLIYKKKLSREHFDIMVAIKDGFAIKEMADFKNADKKFGWIHTDYNNFYYTYDLFGGPENELDCMKKYDKIVCVAADIKQSIIDQIGDPGNLCVLYNPIDIENVLEKAEEPVVDLEPKKDGIMRFVTVGRLNYQKGYDMLLEACHMLEVDGLDYELIIIGGEESWSDEHYRLYRKQNKLGLKNVKFIGGRKNPYKYMKQADWFISSSNFEGYSLVSQEAAVLDVPLILTDCSGVRELLGDSEYGIVMNISVLDIYQNMKRVIENPELRDYYKQKIIERKSIISFDERLEEILKLFN